MLAGAAGQVVEQLTRWSTQTLAERMLAISEQASTLSLVGQLGSMVLALLFARFVLKSHSAICLVAFAGACGAMISHILVDGQGAFLLLFYTPVIYLIAVVGRRDLA